MIKGAVRCAILILFSATLAIAGSAPTSPEAIALGKQVYAKQCSPCHGIEGRGDGEASYLLYPRPRNFRAGKFRLVSTWDGVPTDDDLFQTISRGMPGSAMPSWGHLLGRHAVGARAYVKSLVETPLQVQPASRPGKPAHVGTGVITVPPEPPYDAAAKARAAQLFREGCASCHGATARGDGVADADRLDTGLPTRPRDLTIGVFKGSPRCGESLPPHRRRNAWIADAAERVDLTATTPGTSSTSCDRCRATRSGRSAEMRRFTHRRQPACRDAAGSSRRRHLARRRPP